MMSKAIDLSYICPTEDALKALLEYLVDPRLPSKSAARSIPAKSDQELVGKQVHAVVLLYNYYYRKQHPHLEFLGFENFCKLAVILRPTLLAYLKLMQLSNETELNDVVNELSSTEKVIMDACDISTSLDVSIIAPKVEGWPISKVAVFLIDLREENCLLNFGSITEGVWSLIEKDVDPSNLSSTNATEAEPINKKKRFIRKPVKNVSGVDEAYLQQLAFSVVMEATGINRDDLLIMERHDVYSTSKEKTAACFYIMQCTKLDSNQVTQIPIKDAVNSVQGSLFVRSSGRWMHTSVVEYFHLLPYADILSEWLFRKSSSSQVKRVGSETTSVNGFKMIERPCLPVAAKNSNGKHPGSKKSSESTKQYDDDGRCAVDLLENFGPCKMEMSDSSVGHNKIKDEVTTDASEVKFKNNQQKTSADACINSSMDKLPCELPPHVEVKKADSLKRQKISKDGSVACGNKNCQTISSDQDEKPLSGLAMVMHHSNSNDLEKVRTVLASKDRELSQVALKVILSKRAKLSLQLRDVEDQIVQCDKNIQTILNGGEDNLALKIESLIEVFNDVSLRSLIKETQHVKDQCTATPNRSIRMPAGVAYYPNPCQELDDICCQKNWILPTYRLFAQDGGFQADVTVKGKDYEYSAGGELQPHPHEARESAAIKMLSELRNAEECPVDFQESA